MVSINQTVKKGISFRLSVFILPISGTVHPISFTLDCWIAQDPREYSVERGVIWPEDFTIASYIYEERSACLSVCVCMYGCPSHI